MRAIIFLAIVGVAFGNLCRGVSKNDINRAFATARVVATAILGQSCPSFDLDTVAFSGECRSLVRQATCYGLKTGSLYDVDTVNYGHLEADVPNLEKLGNLACDQARDCLEQVKAAMQTCLANNVDFVQDTIDAAERAYKDNFEDGVANKGSMLGDLASMGVVVYMKRATEAIQQLKPSLSLIQAMDQFSSAGDIRSFIEEHLTKQANAEQVIADARAAAEEAQRLAQAWCDGDCTSKTARFLEGIFGHMNGGGCSDASKFCGDCQSRAASYFTRNKLPCCVEKVVQKGIETYDYVVENYEEALPGAFGEKPSTSGYEEAVAIKDRVVTEFGCVIQVYSANKPVCA